MTTGMSIKEARQSLASIVSDSGPRIADNRLQTVVKLCQKHPSLALESFARHGNTQPLLTIIVEEATDLTLVKIFCEKFPASPAVADEENGNLPLHAACGMAQPLPGLIAWMAKQYPSVVSRKNSRGDLPLHVLLSSGNNPRSSLSLSDLKALVDIYPESTVMTSVDRKTAAETVLQDPNIPQEVREYVCSRVPRCVRYFQLRSSPSTVNQNVAKALCKLLPQVSVLECKRTIWDAEGWGTLLAALETNRSIRSLSLVLPHNLPFSDYEEALQRMVQRNSCISKLTLYDNFVATSMKFADRKDLTTVVVALLQHNVVQSLTLIGVHLNMDSLIEPLTHNTSLTEWNVEYCYTLCWNTLTKILSQHNTSLKKVMVPSKCSKRKDILYWTALNQYGREKVRRCWTTMDFVSQLESLNHQDYVIQQGMRIEMYQVRMGLLRESPDLWN